MSTQIYAHGENICGTSNDANGILYTKSDGTKDNVQTGLNKLTSEINTLNNNLNSKLKIQSSTFDTDAYGAAWIGSQKSDGSFPIFAWAGGDQWLECTILGQVSNNVMQYAVRLRNHDGTPYANKTSVTVGVVWANPTR